MPRSRVVSLGLLATCLACASAKKAEDRSAQPDPEADVEPVPPAPAVEEPPQTGYAEPPPAPPPPAPPATATAACGELPDTTTLKTWEVVGVYRQFCGGAADPRFRPPVRIKDLGDGTFISESAQRGCFRARYKPCRLKCLPPDTMIATPSGEIAVSELREGMQVWTRGLEHKKVRATIIATSSVITGPDHLVVAIELADGRSVEVSVGHPAVDGRGVEMLESRDTYDGAEIRSVEIRPYRGSRTFDILPSGTSRIYWANGIPLESTL